MTTVNIQRATGSSTRVRLILGMAALAVLQLFHLLDVLRYDNTASFPGVLVDRQAIIGMGLTVVAFLLLVRRHPAARLVTIMAAAVVAVGFVIHHGIPAHIDGVTNPYWTAADGNRADWIRWTTVLMIIAVGGIMGMTAWRASPDVISERA